MGGAEDEVHLLAAFGVFVGEVHASEGDVAFVVAVGWADGVMDGVLGGEGERFYAVVAEVFAVVGDFVGV